MDLNQVKQNFRLLVCLIIFAIAGLIIVANFPKIYTFVDSLMPR